MKQKKPNPLPELKAGDCLLYFTRGSISDIVIGIKTWCLSASHIEVYAGNYMSFASRNGIGVNRYLFRRNGLAHILRPMFTFEMKGALEFFGNVRGTKYGWLDLLQFVSINIPTRGLICSQFADLLYRAAGVPAFNREYNAGAICPRDFLTSSAFTQIWKA
jgi:hypothetical protein